MGIHSEEPLCTPACSQRLKDLSQKCVGPGGSRGWADCFGGAKDSESLSNSSEQGTQKKRKSSQIDLSSDGEETEQPSKRSKVDTCSNDCVEAAEEGAKDEISGKLESVVDVVDVTDEKLQPATDSERPHDALPQHLKVTTDAIKFIPFSQVYLFCPFHCANNWVVIHTTDSNLISQVHKPKIRISGVNDHPVINLMI